MTLRSPFYAVLLILLLFAGPKACISSGPTANERDRLVAKIAIQYATLKVIDGKSERAARVISVVDQMIAVAEDGQVLTAADLAAQAKALVQWEKIEVPERLLVSNLIDIAAAEVAQRIPPGAPVELGPAKEVLGWVKEAAQLSIPQPS